MFKYPVFISYPRVGKGDSSVHRFENQDTGIIAFARKLRDCLNIEFESYERDFKVQLDDDFLETGRDLDLKLAEIICKSYCFIIVFTPSYLSHSHRYCCREMITIQEHEKRRFEILKNLNIEVTSRSLVIPIILRGKWEQFPQIFNCKTPISYDLSKKSLWIQSGFKYAQEKEVYELNKMAYEIAEQVVHWKELCHSCNNWNPPKNCFEIFLPNMEDDKVNQLVNKYGKSSGFPRMINTF